MGMTNGETQPLGFWRRWASLLVVAAALLPVTALQPYSNGPPVRSDGVGYHIWTYALLTGQWSFTWYAGDHEVAGLHQPNPERPVFQNKYPPGVALIRLPFMAWCVDRSQPPGTFTAAEHWMVLVLGAVALLVTIFLLLDCCRRLGAAAWACHTAVLFLTFGTGLFHYATYDASYSHVYSALGITLLLWLAVRSIRDGDGRLPILPTAATIFLLLLVRNSNAIFIIFYGVGIFLWGRRGGHRLRNATSIGAGAALAVTVQLALNSYANGRLTFSSYGAETFLWKRPMWDSVLLSYDRGLFTYYPVLALVLALALLVRRTRLAAAGLTGLILAYALLYGFWHSWALGAAGFGHRGFVEFVPLAVPLLAVSLGELRPLGRTAACLLSGACVCVTLSFMGGYWSDTYPAGGATAADYWHASYRLDRVLGTWIYVAQPKFYAVKK